MLEMLIFTGEKFTHAALCCTGLYFEQTADNEESKTTAVDRDTL